MKNIIFLDIDGVLNCQSFYKKRSLSYTVKQTEEEQYKEEICQERMKWLNQLCIDTDSSVVISSSWRLGKETKDLERILEYYGATFKIIGRTDYLNGIERGVEIRKWLDDNTKTLFNILAHNYYNYVIIDDDNDMLLSQREHFFQTDNYSGLTPNICYSIGMFLNRNNRNSY